MASETQGSRNPLMVSQDTLGFYIASSDQDLLSHVSKLVNRCGCIGLMDTAGRVQYLVDGRKGSPFAARRIEETAGRLFLQDEAATGDYLDCCYEAIEAVLAQSGIAVHLKGYRYIRFILQVAARNATCLRPVSKTLYPETAAYFHVSPSQIERDLRYAIKGSTNPDLKAMSNTAAICTLFDTVHLQARTQFKHRSEPM